MTHAEATSRRKTPRYPAAAPRKSCEAGAVNVFVGLDDAAWWSFDDDNKKRPRDFLSRSPGQNSASSFHIALPAATEGRWRRLSSGLANALRNRRNINWKRFCASCGGSSGTGGCFPITSSSSGTRLTIS